MPLVDFGRKSYACICLFVSYFYKCSTREWVTEAMTEMSLNQSGAEESSVVKHSLERNLESMEKNLFSILGVCNIPETDVMIWSCYF